MKKFFVIVLVSLSAACILSCNDSISSNDQYSEEYVLYCIINPDSTFQTAYITRSYIVDGFDPYKNTIDPALEGASVTLKVNNNSIYTFQEGTTERRDTSRYKTPLKYYSINNYKPKDLDKVEIEAVLKNGKVLKSNLVIPFVSYFRMYSKDYPYFPGGIVSNDLVMLWFYNERISTIDYFFYSKLYLVYSKVDDPDTKIKVLVPSRYTQNEGQLMPVFPQISKSFNVVYKSEGIARVLNLISEGDPNKDNYIIHECEFTVQLIEQNLAEYLLNVINFKDEFSIRLDPVDYSNIQNGYGLFGASSLRKAKVRIEKLFITALGYRTSY